MWAGSGAGRDRSPQWAPGGRVRGSGARAGAGCEWARKWGIWDY
jgi:hypothetical protein